MMLKKITNYANLALLLMIELYFFDQVPSRLNAGSVIHSQM